MNKIRFLFPVIMGLCLMMTSCQKKERPEPPLIIMKQVVPVSSIPLGAQVYADGELIGTTPIAVTLERNRHHQITVFKDGFVPQNVAVECKRDPAKSLGRAFTTMLENSGSFDDPIAAAATSFRKEEYTGEASMLEPAVVSVELVPEK